MDTELAATLVHVFVTHRIDYCNVLLAGAPKATTDKLQRLLNAAARLLSGTKKSDHGLSQLMHVDLHWLDVPEPVKYKRVTMVYNCLHGKAPSYLTDCCTPVLSQTLRHGVLPVVVNYSSLDTISPHMVVGLFLSRVRLPGTA